MILTWNASQFIEHGLSAFSLVVISNYSCNLSSTKCCFKPKMSQTDGGIRYHASSRITLFFFYSSFCSHNFQKIYIFFFKWWLQKDKSLYFARNIMKYSYLIPVSSSPICSTCFQNSLPTRSTEIIRKYVLSLIWVNFTCSTYYLMFLFTTRQKKTTFWALMNIMHSQLSPCRHPAMTDIIQIPIYRGLTENHSRYYGLSLFQTQNDVPKVSAITTVDMYSKIF